MIGIGDAIGGSIELILLLSLFSLIAVPTISTLGFKRMKFISKTYGIKRILILTLLYVSILLFGHLIMIGLIQYGFYYCLIWIISLTLAALIFNTITIKKTKHNKT